MVRRGLIQSLVHLKGKVSFKYVSKSQCALPFFPLSFSDLDHYTIKLAWSALALKILKQTRILQFFLSFMDVKQWRSKHFKIQIHNLRKKLEQPYSKEYYYKLYSMQFNTEIFFSYTMFSFKQIDSSCLLSPI